MRAFASQQELISLLKQVKANLQQQWPVESLSLFGSWARNEGQPTSDVDLIITFTPEADKTLGLFAFMNIVAELEDALGCKVDLVEKDALKPQLARFILPEALVL
jgi:uncharacterized protein